MRTALGQSLASLALVAVGLSGLACNETRTPTEPATFVSPTPAPTPIPQAATMSGKVTWLYGDAARAAVAGVTVECQGRSTITSSDGAYSLTGLMSGKTTVEVHGAELGPYPYEYPTELKPGSNTVDLGLL